MPISIPKLERRTRIKGPEQSRALLDYAEAAELFRKVMLAHLQDQQVVRSGSHCFIAPTDIGSESLTTKPYWSGGLIILTPTPALSGLFVLSGRSGLSVHT